MAIWGELMNGPHALAAALVLLSLSWGQALAQSSPEPPSPSAVSELEDVVVDGSPLERRAEAFVRSVGAAAEGRKLATWPGRICVGAIGVAVEPARVMVDRVLDWGYSLGLRVGAPGCQPNILVVFSDDGDRTARELVEARPQDFDAGISSSHLGKRALLAFQSSGRPVRWWHVSLPIDPDTGRPIVRLPGQAPFAPPSGGITHPSDLGSFGQITLGSRLFDDTLDALQSVVIVVEVAALEQASFAQLSDYVAMIALAQIEPEARPAAPSILTIFEPDAVQEPSLTHWDQAFLQALYGTHQRNVSPQSDSSLIARGVARRLQELGETEDSRVR